MYLYHDCDQFEKHFPGQHVIMVAEIVYTVFFISLMPELFILFDSTAKTHTNFYKPFPK